MRKYITLNEQNIRHIIERFDIKPMYAGLGNNTPWDGCLEGSEMEHYVDPYISNYVRVGIVENNSESEVCLFNKDILDVAIDSMIDKKALAYRVVQRQQSDFKDDYLEFYTDILDPMLESIKADISACLYVNAYDYVLDRAVDKDFLEEFHKQQLPKHDVDEALFVFYGNKSF